MTVTNQFLMSQGIGKPMGVLHHTIHFLFCVLLLNTNMHKLQSHNKPLLFDNREIKNNYVEFSPLMIKTNLKKKHIKSEEKENVHN